MSNKFYLKIEGETKEEILEEIEKIKKSLNNAIIGEEGVVEEDECDGDCENCENYVEDPEEVAEDLGKALGCMLYYNLPLPILLVHKYNKALFDIGFDDEDEDS